MSADNYYLLAEQLDGSWQVSMQFASDSMQLSSEHVEKYASCSEALGACTDSTEYGHKVLKCTRKAATGLFASLDLMGFSEEFADFFAMDFSTPKPNLEAHFPMTLSVLSCMLFDKKYVYGIMRQDFDRVSKEDLVLLCADGVLDLEAFSGLLKSNAVFNSGAFFEEDFQYLLEYYSSRFAALL